MVYHYYYTSERVRSMMEESDFWKMMLGMAIVAYLVDLVAKLFGA